MLLKVRQFYYNQINEIYNYRHEAQNRVKYFIKLFILIVTLIRFFLSIITYSLQISWLDYWRYDPCSWFIYVIFPGAYFQYIFIITMIFIFTFVFLLVLCFPTPNSIFFEVTYEISVLNINQLEQCLLDDHYLLLKNEYEQKLNNISLFKLKLFQLKIFKFFISQWCWHWTKFNVAFYGKNIDAIKLSQYKLDLFPYITLKCRAQMATVIRYMDHIYFLMHLILGNYLTHG